MKEILIDLLKTSSNRIKHPLISSFILSHIIYNWNFYLVLILSDLSIENKILYIKIHAGIFNFLIPLTISIFYILCFPYINNFFTDILENAKMKENKSRLTSVDRMMKVKLMEAKYERQIAEEKAGTKELETLNNQIELLKVQSDSLYREKEELISINNKSNADYNSLLRELENQKELFNKSLNIDYSIIEDSNKNLSMSAKQLLLKFDKYNKTKRFVIIEPESGDFNAAKELLSKNLISKVSNLFDDFSYELSELGKIYIKLLSK
ncbi:hypothetical protein AR438_08705 [Chryseobacterium aquaticum]|uniref:Uncharacterized protein n=1 Tax=Chryseobacterium aquaticum TaxID=452084 RepID=A0A0Q3KNG4_9FLAO|nr:hypothetical protein [Chryseobacterium aquaticum]KQK25668.1 hypothetical protein AR438_08705 [Chryseobacterium aquaticum]